MEGERWLSLTRKSLGRVIERNGWLQGRSTYDRLRLQRGERSATHLEVCAAALCQWKVVSFFTQLLKYSFCSFQSLLSSHGCRAVWCMLVWKWKNKCIVFIFLFCAYMIVRIAFISILILHFLFEAENRNTIFCLWLWVLPSSLFYWWCMLGLKMKKKAFYFNFFYLFCAYDFKYWLHLYFTVVFSVWSSKRKTLSFILSFLLAYEIKFFSLSLMRVRYCR